jgi:hypothetical protein
MMHGQQNMEAAVSMYTGRLMAENLMWVANRAVIKNPITIVTHPT